MRGSASPQDRPHPQIIAGDLCTCNGPMWRGPFDNTILLTEYFCNEKGGILVLSQHLSDSATALGIEGMKSNFALSEYSKREPSFTSHSPSVCEDSTRGVIEISGNVPITEV